MPNDERGPPAIRTFLASDKISNPWHEVLAVIAAWHCPSAISSARCCWRGGPPSSRGVPLDEALAQLVQNRVEPLPRRERGEIAMWLTEAGISQRQVHELTGVSRDTIRKKTKSTAGNTGNEE